MYNVTAHRARAPRTPLAPAPITDQVARAYKSLWGIERAFRETKSTLEVRPAFHHRDGTTLGHIVGCFLAPRLEVDLPPRTRPLASGTLLLRARRSRRSNLAEPLTSAIHGDNVNRGTVVQESMLPKSGPRVAIIDSRRGRYVETPDIEERVLGPDIGVELLRVETPEELHGHLEEIDGIISWHHISIGRELLVRLRRCRGIVRAAVGFDNIDLNSAAECQIPVCNVPDYGTEEVADHTLALLLGVVRRLRVLDEHCRQGGWDWRAIGRVQRLRGATLGILGFGRIGSAVARRAMAFGMDVVFYDPYLPSGVEKSHGVRRAETFEELLGQSSILSVHVPLTVETRRMVDERALALLPPGAVLINTARGPVVEQGALIAALASGRLDGAGLDVLASEPDVPEALRASNRVLLTAHAAFYADAALTELREKAARIVVRLLGGKSDRNLLNGVDRVERAR